MRSEGRSEDAGSWITTTLMMVGLAVLCCLGFILTVGGCTTTDICSRTSDCANGLVCSIQGKCVVAPVDAATEDGTGTADAASTPADASPDAAIGGGP